MIARANHGNGERRAGGEVPGREERTGEAGAARPSPVEPLIKDLQALRAYAQHYLLARSDALRQRVRRLVLWVILGAGAGLMGAVALIVAVVLAIRGIADGIGALLGQWAGELITGFGLLLLVAGTAVFVVRRVVRSSAQRTVEKYERRRKHERADFGRDVGQRAARQVG